MRLAVDAEQTDRRRDERLRRLAARCAAAPASVSSARLSPILPERERRIVLQRAVELGDRDQRVERVRRLVVAERLDDGAAEEVFAAADLAHQRLAARADRRPERRAASARTSAGRTNSACSLSSAASSCGTSARSGLCSKKL